MARINLGKVVPEKGIDYFTDAEVEEIKNEIKVEIDAQGMARDIELLKTDSGHSVELTLDPQTYQIVLVLKNAAGTALSTQTIDLPNENAITNLAYNNGILTVTKQSGATSQINLTGLIEGLVTESDFNTFKEALQTTLEAINEKDTEQDEAIAENYKVINKLNEKLENQQKVIDQLPQVTGQGTSITLENTIEAPFTIFDVEGNSVQDGSPSPDNEVPIKSAGDNGTINEKIQTRNWFDVSKISQLIKNGTTTSDGITNIDNVITINKTNGQHGSYAMNYLMPIKSGQITVSFKALLSGTHSNTGILVTLYNSTATIYATTAQTKYASSKDKWLDYNATFELNQEAIDGIHLDIQAVNTGNVIQIKDIQVELGSTATSYVEHEEQDYSIPVQQPMRSIGDVRDCFVKKSDSWYERHYITELGLDGTENWSRSDTTGFIRYVITLANMKSVGLARSTDILCNIFKPSTENGYNHCFAFNNTVAFYVPENIEEFSQFKELLQEKNAKLQYKLAEPLDLPCTEIQIQQLENKPSTYKDFTIIQSEDETPAYLEVSGIYDLNKLITRTEVLESEV